MRHVHGNVNVPVSVNIDSHSPDAVEQALGELIVQLLGEVEWLEDIRISSNPAPFQRAFDWLASFKMPRKFVIGFQCLIVCTLVTVWAGQDFTLSPGWMHPMFYWDCITGVLAVTFLLIGLRLRRGTNEFISY